MTDTPSPALPTSNDGKTVDLPKREEDACLVPGEPDVPVMVVLGPGPFIMGTDSDAERDKGESPAHTVTIPKPFAMGRCEVTVAQFRRFVQETGHVTVAEKDGCWTWNLQQGKFEQRKDADWRSPGFQQDDSHPVVCVARADAIAYARWLTQRTGGSYRLPSEAEWEYAARAGTTGPRYWDNAQGTQCDYANGADQAAKVLSKTWSLANCNDGFTYTAPVARFRPNAFGMYDVLGNALEWVADCYHEDYRGAPDDGSVWQDGSAKDCRPAFRGGSWNFEPLVLRSSFRDWNSVDEASNLVGFRVARDL